MKLMVRFRGVEATPTLLTVIKAVVREALATTEAQRVSALFTEEGGLVECRLEVGLARGAVWVVRAVSDDALVALEAAGDRLGQRLSLARAVSERDARPHAA